MSSHHAPSHWLRSRSRLSHEIIQEASEKQFIHPAEAMDKFGDEQAEVLAREMFVKMLTLCIPHKAHGVDRKKVGFKRMCVLTYLLAPQFFNGMTQLELAAYLDITYQGLKKEINCVKSLITTINNKDNV